MRRAFRLVGRWLRSASARLLTVAYSAYSAYSVYSLISSWSNPPFFAPISEMFSEFHEIFEKCKIAFDIMKFVMSSEMYQKR